MVGRQALALLVGVRILLSQPLFPHICFPLSPRPGAPFAVHMKRQIHHKERLLSTRWRKHPFLISIANTPHCLVNTGKMPIMVERR